MPLCPHLPSCRGLSKCQQPWRVWLVVRIPDAWCALGCSCEARQVISGRRALPVCASQTQAQGLALILTTRTQALGWAACQQRPSHTSQHRRRSSCRHAVQLRYLASWFVVGERASAQSPTHSEALKTASSDAQKTSASTPSAAGVTLYFLLGGQTAHSGESHIKRGGGKKAFLVAIKCNNNTAKNRGTGWLFSPGLGFQGHGHNSSSSRRLSAWTQAWMQSWASNSSLG